MGCLERFKKKLEKSALKVSWRKEGGALRKRFMTKRR